MMREEMEGEKKKKFVNVEGISCFNPKITRTHNRRTHAQTVFLFSFGDEIDFIFVVGVVVFVFFPNFKIERKNAKKSRKKGKTKSVTILKTQKNAMTIRKWLVIG